MTRTFARKVQYVITIAVVCAAVIWSLLWFRAPFWAWATAVAMLLVPGRIVGHYYRDLFRGRRLMDAGRFAEAVPYFERFLDRIRARPGLKRLIWLSAGIFTRDVEAMTLNNLGAARLELGELDRVEGPLRQALAVDPDYPIPYVNLARLALLRGDLETAAGASRMAKRLGHHDSSIDALIHRASSGLAALEGR